MGKTVVFAAGCLLFVACGGQSVVAEDDGGAGEGSSAGTGGRPGQGGAGGQGTSGRPGGSSGNATAGSFTIGGSAGSGQLGGAGNAGTTNAGSAGTAPLPLCELPLEGGMCDAYFPSYGFNPSSRYCQRFIYGGCGGNDNRFESLSACEAACGGSSEGGCPDTMPSAPSMCGEPEKVCHYLSDGCACAWTGSDCLKIDPYCPALVEDQPPPDGGQSPDGDETPCVGPDCPSKVVVAYLYICSCGENGWDCVARIGGYGPR